MPYVLILAFATASSGLQYPSFAMQEFNSKATCEEAKKTAQQMSAAMVNTNREVLQAECKPK